MKAPLQRLLAAAALTAGLLTAIFAAGCSSPPPVNGNLSDSPTLSGWHLVELYGDPVKTMPAPTLTLYSNDGKTVGNTGLNSYSLEFFPAEKGLKAGPITTTKMGGSPEMMETEGVFIAALTEANGWRVGPGTLELISHQGDIARFSKTPWSPTYETKR